MCSSSWNVFFHNCLDENAEQEPFPNRMNDQTVNVFLKCCLIAWKSMSLSFNFNSK